MKRTVEDLEISITESRAFIQLVQHTEGDGPATIMLSPDQIDQTIEWLKEAKESIERR